MIKANHIKIFWILSILILVILAKYLLDQQQIRFDKSKEGFKNHVETLDLAYQNIIHNQHYIESATIKQGLVLEDEKYQSHSLDSILAKHKNLLVLRFFWDTCESCQIQEIQLMNQLKNEDLYPIIIGSFRNAREFHIYMKGVETKIPAFQLSQTESLFENADYLGLVYSFVASDNQPRLVHVANSSFPEVSEYYFNFLNNL